MALPLLISTYVSTAGVTRSWGLEFLQHYLTERIELVWALEGIRSKHTFYSPFIFGRRAGGAASRLPHGPKLLFGFNLLNLHDHWYVEASALRTEWKHKHFQPVNHLKSNCWLCSIMHSSLYPVPGQGPLHTSAPELKEVRNKLAGFSSGQTLPNRPRTVPRWVLKSNWNQIMVIKDKNGFSKNWHYNVSERLISSHWTDSSSVNRGR